MNHASYTSESNHDQSCRLLPSSFLVYCKQHFAASPRFCLYFPAEGLREEFEKLKFKTSGSNKSLACPENKETSSNTETCIIAELRRYTISQYRRKS